MNLDVRYDICHVLLIIKTTRMNKCCNIFMTLLDWHINIVACHTAYMEAVMLALC